MPNTPLPMKLLPEEERFLRHWMFEVMIVFVHVLPPGKLAGLPGQQFHLKEGHVCFAREYSGRRSACPLAPA
jgi:hypothetical protein